MVRPPRRPMRSGPVAMLVTAVLLVCGLLVGAAGAASTAANRPAPAGTPVAVANRSVTLVGVPGLRWSDLIGAESRAPTLVGLARESALGSIVVRTGESTACPLDGWLSLNSGARAVGPRPGGRCAPVPRPAVVDGALRIRSWDTLVAPNARYSYDPVWGTLAGRDVPAGDRACAVGPGAAIALADAQGRVQARYAERPSDLSDPTSCDLLVVDPLGAAGDVEALPVPGPARAAAVQAVDATVADLDLGERMDPLIVAGIADSELDEPHLGAAFARPAPDRSGLLRALLHASSTRQPGLLQLTDLTPAALRGSAPADLVGTPLTKEAPSGIASPDAAMRNLHHLDVAAQVMRTQFAPFFVVLIAAQVLLYGLAALALRAGRLGRAGTRRAVRAAGLGFGAAPVSTVLANLLDWPAAGRPALALWAAVVGFAVAIAAVAAAGPWRRHHYGPAGFVAAVTVAVLAIDVATGSRLQLNALFGLSPLIGGRFYGFGNIAFAVFAMAVLIAASWAGSALVGRGRARAGAVVVAGLGALGVAVTGWPDAGADFGGVLALLPGVAVLAAGLMTLRFTALRLAALAGCTVAAVAAVAIADWTRPAAERSHLGRFVQDVLDGRAGEVIARKAGANLGLLVDAPLIVVVALPLLVLVVLGLVRPAVLGLQGLAAAQRADPVLRPLLTGCLTTALVGFAVNDSGVIVPATALVAAAPLAAAVWVGIWAGVPGVSGPGAATAAPAGPPAPGPRAGTDAAGAPGPSSRPR